jgi:hypothetical protein
LRFLRIVAVMRRRVVARQTDLGVVGPRVFCGQQQRADARDVGLERQELEVEHQRRVLFAPQRNAPTQLGPVRRQVIARIGQPLPGDPDELLKEATL